MVQLPDGIKSRLYQLREKKNDPQLRSRFETYWNSLMQGEQFLLDFIRNGSTEKGNIVIANMLYTLNHEIDADSYHTLKELGLPESKISPATMEKFLLTVTDQPGHVEVDGILCQNSPYAGLDPNWIELFISYAVYQEFQDEFAPFGTTPSVLSTDSKKPLSIVIMGDWGTGPYNDFEFSSPSSLVSKVIKSLHPDITVHLGDVYYAGEKEQIIHNLLSDFPSGNIASYTMTGNHEMFDGANGYFKTALTHPVFIQQQQTSYFAIQYNDWVVIGLDTAYYDKSLFHLEGNLNDEDQLAFIKNLEIKDHQKIILLTHHTAISVDGSQINNPLFNQIYIALGNRYPDYWYYGHIHNGVVYNDSSAQGIYKCHSGLSPQIRCFGHASIPIGNATGLNDGKGNPIKGIDYYARTPMPNPENQAGLKNRVLNGFVILTLTGNKITEQVYEVSEEEGAIPVWNNDLK
jgi:hypothetical protein